MAQARARPPRRFFAEQVAFGRGSCLFSRKNSLFAGESSLFSKFKLPDLRPAVAVGDGLQATSAARRRRGDDPSAPPLLTPNLAIPASRQTSIARGENSCRKPGFVLHLFSSGKAANERRAPFRGALAAATARRQARLGRQQVMECPWRPVAHATGASDEES